MKGQPESGPVPESPVQLIERSLFHNTSDDLKEVLSPTLSELLETNKSFENFFRANSVLNEEQVEEHITTKLREVIDTIKDANRRTKKMPKRFPTKLIEIKETVNTPILENHFFGKISTEHSIENTKSVHSQSDCHSQNLDKRNKRQNVIKLSREEIQAQVSKRMTKAPALNMNSMEIEFTFLFRFRQIIEKMTMLIPANVSLMNIKNMFISKINEKKIILEGLAIRKYLNPDKFVFRMLADEIQNYTREDLESIDQDDYFDICMDQKITSDNQFA
jgi:hypothetical protein